MGNFKFAKNFLVTADHRSVSCCYYIALYLNVTSNPISSAFISKPFIYTLPVCLMYMSRSHIQAFWLFLKLRGHASGMECVGEKTAAGTGQLILTLCLCRCYTLVLPDSFLLFFSYFTTSPPASLSVQCNPVPK